jgi:hypothetical protein
MAVDITKREAIRTDILYLAQSAFLNAPSAALNRFCSRRSSGILISGITKTPIPERLEIQIRAN